MNKTIFQFFHWYASDDGNLWHHVAAEAGKLKELGITDAWLPPAYKSAHGVNEPGYAVYDLYDLGEFDQKGTIPTRYGTKEDYLNAIHTLHEHHMGVIADIVFNHKVGGDETEKVPAQQVNPENRNEKIAEPEEVDAHTLFEFPGRKGQYSSFVWNWQCFSGFSKEDKIYIILNEYTNGQWEEVMETQYGNFDYLMGADIEFRNPYVREELINWGKWYIETTGIDGFRLDAVKHINTHFFPEWLQQMKDHFQKDFFCIGEYWKGFPEPLLQYLDATHEMIQLFDVPLHFNFYNASKTDASYDMRSIFDNSILQRKPHRAITFVDNHDTQPLQDLESTVEEWFKPLANAIILLREQGIPCVFYPALYGAAYHDTDKDAYVEMHKVNHIETLLFARKEKAYGQQHDYFDHENIVGWTREGIDEIDNSGCAVLISNGAGGEKYMQLGERNAGKTVKDSCGTQEQTITLDDKGGGIFTVGERDISVWTIL